LVKKRRQPAVEQALLLGDRLCRHQIARIGAIEARKHVADADEAAEETAPIEAAGKERDTPAAEEVAVIPVATRRGVETAAKVALVGRDIGLVLGLAEEAEEGLVVGQVARRGELETGEGDVAAIEIDRDDLTGIGGEVRQDVAAARGDRN